MLLLPRRKLLSGAAALALLPRLTRAQDTVVRRKAAAPGVNTANLVAYWKLDETSGTRNDSVGTNHLTANNSPSGVTGLISNAAQLNGSSKYLSIADNAALSIGANTSFALSFWVNLNSTGGPQIFACKGSSAGSAGQEFQVYLNTTFQFDMGNGSTGHTLNSSVTPSTATWYHVYAEYNHSIVSMGLSINNGTLAQRNDGNSSYDSTYEMTLGRWSNYNGGYMDGLIDEVAFWKGYVLTSAERTTVYNAGVGKTYPFS